MKNVQNIFILLDSLLYMVYYIIGFIIKSNNSLNSTKMAKGIKELHPISSDKKISCLFSQQEMIRMESEGITKEAYYFFLEEGVDMKKCGTCECWPHLRYLNLYTNGLMTSCVPCIKDKNI